MKGNPVKNLKVKPKKPKGNVLAREFLWFMTALVLAFPLGLVFLWLMGIAAADAYLTAEEEAFVIELYLLGILISFVCVYIMRFVSGALAVMAKSNRVAREIDEMEHKNVKRGNIIPTRMLRRQVEMEINKTQRDAVNSLFKWRR